MTTNKAIRKALQVGRKQAKRVLNFRASALRRRANALKNKPKKLLTQRAVAIDRSLLRAVNHKRQVF